MPRVQPRSVEKVVGPAERDTFSKGKRLKLPDVKLDLPLARHHLDRAAQLRPNNQGTTEALRNPTTRVVLVNSGQIAVRDGGARLDLVTPADLAELEVRVEQWLFLGLDPGDGAPWLALDLATVSMANDATTSVVGDTATGAAGDAATGAAGDAATLSRIRSLRTWVNLREVGATLDVPGTAAEAVGLAQWHAHNPYCPACGAPTTPAASGWLRICTADGRENYPRTDPAVIVTVRDADDRLLLGHAAQWQPGRYSLLAGFVEPGESFEAAVRREVFEESGIVVGEVRYVASQPWPFPASVMIGMTGQAVTTEITVDEVEVTAARWVTRGELKTLVENDQIRLPMRSSIARALIEDWYGEDLPGGW